MTDVIDHLTRLGLSEYEAKAYIATVALGEGKIKEISEESGVPRSKTYDVMERLAARGMVEAGNSNPICYRANEPRKASIHLMEEIKSANDEVMRYLDDIGRRAEKRDNPIWTLKGDWAIDHKIGEMIEAAKSDIDLVCTNRHLIRYAKRISKASETRSIDVVLVHQPEDFVGLLGNAKILKLNQFWPRDQVPEGGAMSEKGFMIKDGKYNLELLLICDHNDSLLLSKEGESYRAIICTGTVLNYFIQDLMEKLVEKADVVDENNDQGPVP